MQAGGVFPEQRVMLINGRVLEQHHGGPRFPDPRLLYWTREQYRRLGKLGLLTGQRTELIYGEIFHMSPIGWPHVVSCARATDVLRRAFSGAGWVNGQNPFGAGDSDPQPDVAVIPGRIEDYTDHPETAPLVVEVADTTLDRDTTTKAEMYATAGVPDYCVIDLENRRLLVFRDPEALPAGLGATAYRTHLAFGPADSVAPLAAPSAAIKVADLLP
jgi:Uma2 family endonuclease